MDTAGRDRFLDLLRIGGVLVVAFGHWLVLIPHLRAGVASGDILYQVRPEFWPITWVFGVLPLFFFVGGYANYASYRSPRHPAGGSGFLVRRLRRLLSPTLAFLGAWLVVEAVMQALGLGAPGPLRGLRLGRITPFESLWFIGVYLLVVLLAPATIRLHERFGWAVPAALLAATGLVDLLAAGTGRSWILAVNIASVWLLPHQLGYFYADGRLRQLSRRTLLGALAAALLLAAGLTSLPFYGRDLLDGTTSFAGVAGPTLPFALLDVWMVAAALLARHRLNSWLRSERVWRVVSRLNGVAMTIFLWHMTAYFAVLLALVRLGLALPAAPDASWWLERPLFAVLPLAILVPLIWLFGRFERSEVRAGPRPGRRPGPIGKASPWAPAGR